MWYPFLAAAIGLLAAAQLTLPQQFVRWALPAPAGALALPLTQLGGALALLPCAALYTLAVRHKRCILSTCKTSPLSLGKLATNTKGYVENNQMRGPWTAMYTLAVCLAVRIEDAGPGSRSSICVPRKCCSLLQVP